MRTLHNIEFYRFEKEIYYVTSDGEHHKFSEDSRVIIAELNTTIEEAHDEAYQALVEDNRRFKWNITKFQYKIADRFIRCNFGEIDNVADIDRNGNFNFEHTGGCPLRGICHLEGVVCNPKKTTKLGPRTREVMELVFRGFEVPEIALKLGKSPETVRNQQFRGYHILGVKTRAEFIDFAHRNKLFKEED